MEGHPHRPLTHPAGPSDPFRVDAFSPHQRQRFHQGTSLFNTRQFWEAHEAWEDVWKEVEGPRKRVIQGLIQAAAAYHLILTRPRINGALRNIEKSLAKFEDVPAICFGISIEELRLTLQRAHSEVTRIGQENLKDLREDCVPML